MNSHCHVLIYITLVLLWGQELAPFSFKYTNCHEKNPIVKKQKSKDTCRVETFIV